jgi:hypothetical protein
VLVDWFEDVHFIFSNAVWHELHQYVETESCEPKAEKSLVSAPSQKGHWGEADWCIASIHQELAVLVATHTLDGICVGRSAFRAARRFVEVVEAR